MKINCLHKTRTSFFNCHFFGDFKYGYDNNYTNNIIIMIMILIFECDHDFPKFHLQTLLLHYNGRQTIKGFIPCQREPFKTPASFILLYKKTQ